MPISQSLLQLASATPALPLELTEAEELINIPVNTDDYGERGEMGGKRRKLPHERAGWKEMDEGSRKRGKRGVPRGAASSSAGQAGTPGSAGSPGGGHAATHAGGAQAPTSADFQRWDHAQAIAGPSGSHGHVQEHQANLESLQRGLAQVAEMSSMDGQTSDSKLPAHAQHHQQQQADEAARLAEDSGWVLLKYHGFGNCILTKPQRNDKLDRAEQNRRAQQVYRRKREERIKQLEAAAAALEPMRKALDNTVLKLRTLAHVRRLIPPSPDRV